MEVKGGQSGKAGAGGQLVNAVDNKTDEPILEGVTGLLSCLLAHCAWTSPKMLLTLLSLSHLLQ